MNRRHFLTTASALSTGAMIANPVSALFGQASSTQLDRYGGWMEKQFNATGFFRLEKADRWWLVTPEGHAFLSFGINHFHPGWWKQAYNKASWMKRLGVVQEEQLGPALRDWFLKTCRDYGFNSVGVHNDLKLLNAPQPQVPYVQTIQFVDISHWKNTIPDENFVDIFSDAFQQHCDQLAKDIALPLKDDPYLFGYAMADCPLLTEEDCRDRPNMIYGGRRASRIGWPRRLRNLGESSAGKQVYVRLMSRLYDGYIQRFNLTYQTDFNSFEALAQAEQWRPETDVSNANETRDNIEFLKRCVDQYYKSAKEAIHRYDSNHLFLGDKLNGNTDTVDMLLPTVSQYSDLLFYQMYGKYALQQVSLDRWSQQVDIPIINGDGAFTHIREGMPQPYGPIADSEHQNAEWTLDFFRKAFARPEFVGWHICGLIDTPVKLVKKESERQHSGLFDGYGNPYPTLRETMITCSSELYQVALGG